MAQVVYSEDGMPVLEDVILLGAEAALPKERRRVAQCLLRVTTESARGRGAAAAAGALPLLLRLCQDSDPQAQEMACKALINMSDDSASSDDWQWNLEESRLRSFDHGWPHAGTPLTPGLMARAGFYFAPRPDQIDRTVCFWCKGQLMLWDSDDDPLSEHAFHFATCLFLRSPAEAGDVPLAAHGTSQWGVLSSSSLSSDILKEPALGASLAALDRSPADSSVCPSSSRLRLLLSPPSHTFTLLISLSLPSPPSPLLDLAHALPMPPSLMRARTRATAQQVTLSPGVPLCADDLSPIPSPCVRQPLDAHGHPA